MASPASRSVLSVAARLQARPTAPAAVALRAQQQRRRAFTSAPAATPSRLVRPSRCAFVAASASSPTTTTPASSLSSVRRAHSIPRPPPPPPATKDHRHPAKEAPTGLAPHYELTFTCKPCGTRSRHRVSKQGYHHGSVLITCPECHNRHVISDHLRIFGKEARSLEDIMKERGQLVKKGTLGVDSDIEFWEDGTTSDRQQRLASEGLMLPQSNKKETAAQDGASPQPDEAAPPGSTFAKAKEEQ